MAVLYFIQVNNKFLNAKEAKPPKNKVIHFSESSLEVHTEFTLVYSNVQLFLVPKAAQNWLSQRFSQH